MSRTTKRKAAAAKAEELPTLDELLSTRPQAFQACLMCASEDDNAELRADVRTMAESLKLGTCRTTRAKLYDWLLAKYGEEAISMSLSSFRAHLKRCLKVPGAKSKSS